MSSPTSLPIAVVGAGALGAATALGLARAGANVILLDEAPLGRNASGVAAGMLAPAMESALDTIAARVKEHPGRFDRVFHKADLRHLHDRAMLYLPKAELDAIHDRLERMDPLLGRFAPVAWQMLSLQTLLSKASVILKDQAAGKNLPATDRDLLSQLPAVAHSAADTLRHPDGYRNPWGIAAAMSGPAMAPLSPACICRSLSGSIAIVSVSTVAEAAMAPAMISPCVSRLCTRASIRPSRNWLR